MLDTSNEVDSCLFVRHLGGDSEQVYRYKELRRQVWAKSGQHWTLKLGQVSSKKEEDQALSPRAISGLNS